MDGSRRSTSIGAGHLKPRRSTTGARAREHSVVRASRARSLVFRFASGPAPVPIGIDFDGQFCRIGGAPTRDVPGFHAATLTLRAFNILLVAALAPGEFSLSEVQALWGSEGKLTSTLKRLIGDFSGGALLQVVVSRGNPGSAHLSMNPDEMVDYQTIEQAREYADDLFDPGSGALRLQPIRLPVSVSSSIPGNDVSDTLVRFGYAPCPVSVEAMRRAVALVTRRSAEPRHILELGIAAGAGVPIIVTGEPVGPETESIALLRDQHTCIHARSGDCAAVIAALQKARRPNADGALREITALASQALHDTRIPRPASPLPSRMKPARSIAEAAQQQQLLAQSTLQKARGTWRAWRMITTYADQEYKPLMERLSLRARVDSANDEDLLRAFCLARR